MRHVVLRWAETPVGEPREAAHDFLRSVVASVVGIPTQAITLGHRCLTCGGDHGRPVVAVSGGRGPQVSLARAPGLVLVTVSAAGAALGVDVEAVADRSRAATALGEADAAVALRRWVRTEAVLKATGHGLQVDPRLVGISDGAGRPRLASWPGPGRRPRVRIADVEVAAGYVAAVAGLGSRRLRLDSGRAVLSAVR